jgi:GT2 family glycosyltransferase
MEKIGDVMVPQETMVSSDVDSNNICIFSYKCGKLADNAESEFIKAFDENENVELVYGDEGYPHEISWYKPKFSPDTLESFFYIGNVFAIRCDTLKKITYDISIYEMVWKLAKNSKFHHIPKILFTNDSDDESTKLSGIGCTEFKENGTINGDELVSIIIPSKDNSKVLEKCLSSLVEKTEYRNYEIIVVDNGSRDSEKLCINELARSYGFKYIYEKQEFNFSRMCNMGAKEAQGELLLFLNDDIEVIDVKWLYNMLLSAVKPHVGAVGAKLYYPNLQIQHVGITNMGIGPVHKTGNYHGHNDVNYNMIAVTGACLMVRRELFDSIGGFDETFPVAYNDVEFCFRIYKSEFYNVVRNDAVLIHHESLSRGSDTSPEKKRRLIAEKHKLYDKHPDMKAYDPFYSPKLVQWKWDSEYNENILYEYDKKITPVILDRDEVKGLPREHVNKYVKKLIGENLLMLNIDGIDNIDSIENMYGKKMILIRGWVALRDRDNSDEKCKKRLLLKAVSNENVIYSMEIIPKQRFDVASLFDDKTKNASNTGINVFFEEETIPKGKYIIGVLIENNRRFVKWSTETIER